MAEDILHQMSFRKSNTDLQMNEEIYNEALILIETPTCNLLRSSAVLQQSKLIVWDEFLDIGNGEIPVDTLSGYITLHANFRQFTETKTELIEMVSPNIARNCKNHFWLSERVILAAKNVNVNI